MSRVIHFEIPAAEPDRAAAFYGKVFGWKFDKWAGRTDYWMVTTGQDGAPGTNGGMMRKPVGLYSTTNASGFESLDRAVEASLIAGRDTSMPTSPILTVGYFAYCEEPEGNLFGV